MFLITLMMLSFLYWNKIKFMCIYQFIFNLEREDNDFNNMVSIILTYISVRFIIEFDLTPGYSAQHNFCADIVRWCLLNLSGNTRFTSRENDSENGLRAHICLA